MAIAELFLSAFLPVLFEKLASRDLWSLARRERIDTLLSKWLSMLEQIGSVLADAEQKQMTDQLGIKPWLEELEDLAYDLDDVLDEFATEALRRKVMEEPQASTSKVRALVTTCCMNFKPSTIVSGFRMRSQIDEITARLQVLFDRRAGLGLQNVVVGPSAKTSQRPQTSSLILEPRLYGRDEDKKAILELLQCGQSSNEKVGIVPIVGMGGVGKTTLAQDVYNDKIVGEHFEMKAWVCVSEVFDIEKELVFWWMAEGLIQKSTGQKQMEDLGSDYFRELSSRSFFQLSSRGEASRFVMHDLINDLAQFVARRICFRMEEKLENNEGHTIITKARHSSYVRGYQDGIQKFEIFQKAKNLRSFLPFGLRDNYDASYLTSDVPLQLLPRLRRLRVLSLRRYRICELSSSIGDLKHVRFLDLTGALIAALPESVSNLYNLQTLILIDCTNLSKLPTNMSNLINLRHLDVTGANSLQEMPSKIGKLTSLLTLSNFIVRQGNGSTINELGSLIQLRGTLCISGLENVENAMDAKRANLNDKQHLDVLLMKWSNILVNSRNTSVDSEVLDMLRPHGKLKELTINGYHGPKFPTWVGNSLFSNMVNLKFQNCDKCISLPPLGRLPSLTKLYIQGTKALQNVGLEFYGSGSSNPFPALEFLTFADMAEWKDWSPFEVDEGSQAFSRLSELSIIRCPKLLGKLPNNLPSLRNLDIEDCPLLVVAWVPSPTGVVEVRNTLQFDSLISLSLKDVSIPNSFNNPEVGNEVAATENARYSPLSSLTSLRVENIQGLTCLPSWFVQGLTGLQELSLYGCPELTSLWKNEVRIHHNLLTLRRLVIAGCPKLISLFEEDEDEEGLQHHEELPYMLLLEYLAIRNCEKMEKLPRGLHNFRSLQDLIIDACPCIISFPKTGLPSTLRTLHIECCDALRSLPELMMLNSLEELENNFDGGCLKNLSNLMIEDCENVESIPEGWFTATNLRELQVKGCKKLNGLPHHAYNNLTSLQSLRISSWDSATELISHFTNLTFLRLENVNVGGNKPPSKWGLHRLSSLRKLYLLDYGWLSFPPVEEEEEEEEEDGMMLWLPPSLIRLTIQNFPNLEKLSCKEFPSLELLNIWNCPKLMTITKLGLPPSLVHLWISGCPLLSELLIDRLPPSLLGLWIDGCPLLKERCSKKKKGQYWPLISHIPQVKIDNRNVFLDRSSYDERTLVRLLCLEISQDTLQQEEGRRIDTRELKNDAGNHAYLTTNEILFYGSDLDLMDLINIIRTRKVLWEKSHLLSGTTQLMTSRDALWNDQSSKNLFSEGRAGRTKYLRFRGH
ncbi:hypothetical protein RHSIM_Rhsim07G0071000 [Rhododendron simsii]|uniref:Disease resistance RPP13-like protein 1 n=1 Tax=Rhododendron simsii TaxID=118357 RepID=A0A834GM85_RHOSS|nr:hypothetical protein RHSIM_Rhsim07G0071000 [Rhododendron simsii]